MGAAANVVSRKTRIANIIQSPALFFAKLAQRRLEKHWAQTYGVIAVVSNGFIGLVTLVIVPRLLPTTSLAFLIIAPIFSPLILVEYGIFMNKVHRKTVELYDSAPCQLKLTILRVHMKRKLLTAITFGTNFAFSFFALYGASVAFLTAGLPYYITVNAGYLLGFRLDRNKSLMRSLSLFPSYESSRSSIKR